MDFPYFSHNGKILSAEQAIVRLGNIAYAYGFGVYETIRVKHGMAYFLADHAERLMESARIINLEHPFSDSFVADSVKQLMQKTPGDAYNLKLLLIGGHAEEDAALNILCSNPLFPDRKFYRTGVSCTTYEYERAFPHAKTLNMLQSYLAYREAKAQGSYDALLINSAGDITEGTRTNFFCLLDRTIISPPESDILLGITRKVVLKVAAENDFHLEQRSIPLKSLDQYDGAFLTSTSSGIMPIRSIDNLELGPPPPALSGLSEAYHKFLNECGGIFPS
jgi:branched-chain amino acid aminotransferase